MVVSFLLRHVVCVWIFLPFGKYLVGEVFSFFAVGISCSGMFPRIQFLRVFFANGLCGMCDVFSMFQSIFLYFLYVCVHGCVFSSGSSFDEGSALLTVCGSTM